MVYGTGNTLQITLLYTLKALYYTVVLNVFLWVFVYYWTLL